MTTTQHPDPSPDPASASAASAAAGASDSAPASAPGPPTEPATLDAATLEKVKAKAGGRCTCTGCPQHEARCLNMDGQRSFGRSSRHSSVRGPIVELRLVHLDHDPANTAAFNLDVMCPKCAADYESEARILRMAIHRAPHFPRRVSAITPIKGQDGLF